MRHVINHFEKNDPILFRAIGNYSFPTLNRGNNLFADLCEIIIQQQLSERVGDVLYTRFKKLFPKENVTPEYLLHLSIDDIREIGVSRSKVQYMQNVARAIFDKTLIFEPFSSMDDESVIIEITKIKGLGRWSAEMFLMFSLGREDIFSYGDLGLRRAIQKLYSLKKEPTLKQALQISQKWKPYRTHASRILWHSLI